MRFPLMKYQSGSRTCFLLVSYDSLPIQGHNLKSTENQSLLLTPISGDGPRIVFFEIMSISCPTCNNIFTSNLYLQHLPKCYFNTCENFKFVFFNNASYDSVSNLVVFVNVVKELPHMCNIYQRTTNGSRSKQHKVNQFSIK